jgi:hypothetical protein
MEGTGDGNRRPELRGPAARDRDLRARYIELGDARRPGVVDRQRLDTQEVIPVGNACGEVECVCFCRALLFR